MNIRMQSKVISILRNKDNTVIKLDFEGRVQDTKLINAKDADMTAELTLKTAMADNIRVGTVFTIVLADDGPEERLD